MIGSLATWVGISWKIDFALVFNTGNCNTLHTMIMTHVVNTIKYSS